MKRRTIEEDEELHPILRYIKSTPREHWEGRWRRGRRYTLYAVVENNGSVFMAVTGNPKEEPYVIFNPVTNEYVANDGWELREMSADSRISARGGGGGGDGSYSPPIGGIPKTDLSLDVQASLDKADSALQSFTETDPTVPAWAKEPNKPTYTPEEIGALPVGTPIPTDVVKYSSQSLTSEQMAQARTNIGAGTSNFSGNYNDLSSKPTIPAAQKQADWNEADSNDAAYIKNKPTIPAGVTVDQVYDGTSANAQSGVAMAGALAGKQDTISDLQTIRTGAGLGATAVQPEAGKGLFSGNYNDLSNKPTIPDAQVQANWNESDSASKAYIQNKPSIPAAQVNSDWNASSGVAQILNKPTIPDAQIQSDWNQSDNTAKDYIKNKPSIPAAQVNSDWNANSGVAQILNKPSIPDAVEANPTVPSGTTPSDLAGLKVGSSYYGIPALPSVDNTPTKNSTNLVKSGGVYDEVHPATGSSQPAGGMLPNKFYALGTLTGSVTIAFASPTDNNIENEYKFGFTAGSTAPTITWPASITKWAGNALDSGLPNVEASTYYEVSVLNGMGIFNKFE